MVAEAMTSSNCSWSKRLFDTRGCCPACMERQQRRHHRLSGRSEMYISIPTSSYKSSPRPSRDASRAVGSTSMVNCSPAGSALQSAFTEEPDEAASSIFPTSMYRTARRASPRNSMPSSPTQSDEHVRMLRHTRDRSSGIVGGLVRPGTPEASVRSDAARTSYSPMAAGFARLNKTKRNDSMEALEGVERGRTGRSSMDMFDGPA